jgi:hypothetical protein
MTLPAHNATKVRGRLPRRRDSANAGENDHAALRGPSADLTKGFGQSSVFVLQGRPSFPLPTRLYAVGLAPSDRPQVCRTMEWGRNLTGGACGQHVSRAALGRELVRARITVRWRVWARGMGEVLGSWCRQPPTLSSPPLHGGYEELVTRGLARFGPRWGWLRTDFHAHYVAHQHAPDYNSGLSCATQ